MISKLHLDSGRYQDYKLSNKGILTGLNKINVFIGQNNSGKSRFLRSLFEDDKYQFELLNCDFAGLIHKLIGYQEFIRQLFDKHSMTDGNGVYQRIADLNNSLSFFKIGEVNNDIRRIREFGEQLYNLKQISSVSWMPNIISSGISSSIAPVLNKIGADIISEIISDFEDGFDYNIEKIYLPILRGLRAIQRNGDEFVTATTEDNYKRRTLKDYFKELDGTKVKKEIFTGLSLYEDTKLLLLGNKEGRSRIKLFEDFLSRHFFDREPVTLIPDINNDVLLIGIGDEERPVYELGDGIQTLIVLLYPLFINQGKNLVVFIEEPENNMHPGLQRLFLETLMSEQFSSFQYFITTHSNHFLDITLDLDNISVYTFKKNKKDLTYSIENTSNSDVRILDLIGARASSVFLSNCSIWVEGITDRLYLKKYLDLYQEYVSVSGEEQSSYREDFHYSFIEYGGGNIVHWSFTNELGWEKISASKICSKILIVADKDSSDEKLNSAKAGRLKDLKQRLGENFQVVGGREIENILSESLLIKTIQSLEGKNSGAVCYDPSLILFRNYKNEKLGLFIDKNFSGTKRKYAAKSGTISCKLEFCKHSLTSMSSFEELSPEAKKITKSIFRFIQKSNADFA